MSTPTSDFLQRATATLRDVERETGDDYDYLRKVAAGRPPGAAMRERVARWGWRHVRDLVDRLWVLAPEIAQEQTALALRALRATLPGDSPQPAAAPEPPPEKAAVP